MFATAISIVLFVGTISLLVSMIRANGDKIAAALDGQSFASAGPITINPSDYARLSPPSARSSPRPVRLVWRAAA